MSDAAIHLADNEVTDFLTQHASELVVIDFYADWCPHCQTLSPVLEDLAREYKTKGAQIVKVDADTSPDNAEKYQVEALPTLVFIKNGEEVERLTGGRDRATLAQLIDQHLG
jgi:thioredoxin 1